MPCKIVGGTKVFGNEKSWERKFLGTKGPGNESSRELSFPGTLTKVPENERARERKFLGFPGNESSRERKVSGTKVPHRDYSFLGTKALGHEKSRYRAPYSGCSNFRQYFYGIWYPSHPLTSTENFMEIVPGEPLRRGS